MTLIDRLIDLVTRSIDVGLGREAFDFAAKALKYEPLPKSVYRVMLTEVGDTKIAVIKAIRELTGLGLKEAKDLTEQLSPPMIIKTTDANLAATAAEKLKAAGAAISIVQERLAP